MKEFKRGWQFKLIKIGLKRLYLLIIKFYRKKRNKDIEDIVNKLESEDNMFSSQDKVFLVGVGYGLIIMILFCLFL